MNVSDFDYQLPEELIAQRPTADRSASRMLLLRRHSGTCSLANFRQFPEMLQPGDCLVLNDTRVIAARLHGSRIPSGGRVEAFVLRDLQAGNWQALLRPGRRLRPGSRVALDGEPDGFTVIAHNQDGTFDIRFDSPDVIGLLDRAGHVPLPPYIQRQDDHADRERYQTVYARTPGAVAAPTAGLHFTPDLLEATRQRGVHLAHVTLHVGAGTFKPVKVDRVEDHVMHEEEYELTPETAAAITRTRAAGGRVIAVGTTSVRVLETCADPETGTVIPGCGSTDIFLHPPKRPRVVDGLLTNFHLPRSTLLMLVASFSSTEAVLAAYRLAIRERFRFYSYGDCMLLLPG